MCPRMHVYADAGACWAGAVSVSELCTCRIALQQSKVRSSAEHTLHAHAHAVPRHRRQPRLCSTAQERPIPRSRSRHATPRPRRPQHAAALTPPPNFSQHAWVSAAATCPWVSMHRAIRDRPGTLGTCKRLYARMHAWTRRRNHACVPKGWSGCGSTHRVHDREGTCICWEPWLIARVSKGVNVVPCTNTSGAARCMRAAWGPEPERPEGLRCCMRIPMQGSHLHGCAISAGSAAAGDS